MQKYFDAFLMRLKELQGGESVSAFARRLAMPQNTLDCYMRGTRKPSVELLTRVCDTCGVSADWLLGLDDTRAPAQIVAPDNSASRAKQNPFSDVAQSNGNVQDEIAALKRRVKALEDAAGSQSFACG